MLFLKGQIISFSHFLESWDREDKIIRMEKVIGVAKFKISINAKNYLLFLTLPFASETPPNAVKIGARVKIILRRGRRYDSRHPIIYWPKLFLATPGVAKKEG